VAELGGFEVPGSVSCPQGTEHKAELHPKI
jgi:hypothetical protein